jgi:Fe-S-cluster containining protein
MEITKDTKKEDILKLGSDCRKCGNCCRYESGFLAEDDLEKIAAFLSVTPEEVKERYMSEVERFGKKLLRPRTIKKDKPFGECIFLKETICSIHDVKPLMCRIGSCIKEGPILMEWFLLNYVIDAYDQNSIRAWAARLKSHPTIKGGTVNELIPEEDIRKKLLEDEHIDAK